ncbi:MAG: phenylalanine--tRNA ligase subunit beta [Bacteroidota bacterium]
MKVSLNWLKQYINITLSPEKISEILTEIGLEVEGMEKVESIEGGLEGIVVGYVKSCEKHPNSDRLSLTKVDVGTGTDLSIVCGAPNVAKGQKVLVATIGTHLHPTNGEAFKIKKSKIRGEVSEGMLCAEDEIGLGGSHDGIAVLAPDTAIGTPASAIFDIETDYIYDIGLTPNRSDATNHIGVAKDLAAALRINYEQGDQLSFPEVEAFQTTHQELPIQVVVEDEAACPRYAGICIKDVVVKESPEWLQNRLKSIGVKVINNIVDITNFILHEFGQPLHAFDYDKITDQKVIVKMLPEGTIFTTLDEAERKLRSTDLMICDGASKGMCIAGVFGGIHSGVNETTTNIFLESAHFHAKTIRRTSMHHNLRTDAAKVFEKGSDPNISVYALKRAALLIQELAGGKIASDIIDLYPKPIQPVEVRVEYVDVNTLIGVLIPQAKVHEILDALEMEIIRKDEVSFTVKIPTNKADVTRPADVIEEILRIYGLNKVPMSSQIKMSLTYGTHPSKQSIRNILGDLLAANGFNEIMGLSISQSKYYEEILPVPTEELVFIHNTSNVHLDIMRPSMLISGLETVLHNQNRQQTDLQLFEFGRIYNKQAEGFSESERLTLFLTGQRWQESWLTNNDKTSDFYTLKAFVKNILQRVGISGYQETVLEEDTDFSIGIKLHRGKQMLVRFGQVSPKITKALDVRYPVFYADFVMENVYHALQNHKIVINEPSKYPSMRRDLALVVAESVKFQDIVSIARKIGKKLLTDVNLFDVYQDAERLGTGKKSYAVSYQFEDAEKTLKDKEIEKVMNKLIHQYEQKLGATIRR